MSSCTQPLRRGPVRELRDRQAFLFFPSQHPTKCMVTEQTTDGLQEDVQSKSSLACRPTSQAGGRGRRRHLGSWGRRPWRGPGSFQLRPPTQCTASRCFLRSSSGGRVALECLVSTCAMTHQLCSSAHASAGSFAVSSGNSLGSCRHSGMAEITHSVQQHCFPVFFGSQLRPLKAVCQGSRCQLWRTLTIEGLEGSGFRGRRSALLASVSNHDMVRPALVQRVVEYLADRWRCVSGDESVATHPTHSSNDSCIDKQPFLALLKISVCRRE